MTYNNNFQTKRPILDLKTQIFVSGSQDTRTVFQNISLFRDIVSIFRLLPSGGPIRGVSGLKTKKPKQKKPNLSDWTIKIFLHLRISGVTKRIKNLFPYFFSRFFDKLIIRKGQNELLFYKKCLDLSFFIINIRSKMISNE